MDTSESTAKIVDTTYKNIIDEFGPCTKHLVSAGRTYLKSLHAMVAASRQYTEALTKIASLASSSTLKGCSDIGSNLYSVVDVNKEMLAQQSNILKSLEFDFLEPMEIAAEKDTKLIGREQKRFQQLYKGRKEAYLKCVSTLKKTRRKKNINTDKQLSHMKTLESAKERLEIFCNDSLKEAIVQERVMYGTVLERQCALNRQFLIYLSKGCEVLEERLPHWEHAAEIRDTLPESCYTAIKYQSDSFSGAMESLYSLDSTLETVIRNNSIARSYGNKDRNSYLSQTLRTSSTEDNIYARPVIMRAKSEYCLPISSSSSPKSDSALKRYSHAIEDDSVLGETSYAKALYTFEPTGDHQLPLQEGDVIEFITEENTTGWQFGDNLISGRSGWFPVSYTETWKEPSQYQFGFQAMDAKYSHSVPASVESVRSKMNISRVPQEGSEYATLTRSPKKLLNSAFESGNLQSKHYASHPDALETASLEQSGEVYHNGRHLPSMRL